MVSKMSQFLLGVGMLFAFPACSSFPFSVSPFGPSSPYEKQEFPPEAFMGVPDKAHEVIGQVRARVDFQLGSPGGEDDERRCRNFFNKAVLQLVEFAKAKKADAVVDVRSVILLLDGKVETHPGPECADDGQEGQVLVQGVAVRWKN